MNSPEECSEIKREEEKRPPEDDIEWPVEAIWLCRFVADLCIVLRVIVVELSIEFYWGLCDIYRKLMRRPEPPAWPTGSIQFESVKAELVEEPEELIFFEAQSPA